MSQTTGKLTIGQYNRVYDCTIDHSGTSVATILYNNTYAEVKRCYLTTASWDASFNLNGKYQSQFSQNTVVCSNAPTTIVLVGAAYGAVVSANVVQSTYTSSATMTGISVAGGSCAVTGNFVRLGGAADNYGINITGQETVVTGNTVFNVQQGIRINGGQVNTVSGNTVHAFTQYGINITSSTNRANVVGNSIGDGTGTHVGIYIDSTYPAVSGNLISGATTGIQLTASATNSHVADNAFHYCTTNITTASTDSQIIDNMGVPVTQNIKMEYMKNTSGGALAAGDVVVLKAVAAGNEVTTTTTAGDPMVFGVATGTIADNAFGYFQTLGKTTVLKVDGTTNIAIGDRLSCFTTAKIAYKAAATETAFAIALEAYTTDDSSGVIDALLISPRLV
jgi:hypothetical protein